MREQIARALSAEDGWIWEDLNNNYWSGYFRRAGLAISLLIEEIKKVENPYSATRQCANEDGVMTTYENVAHTRVEEFRNEILKKMEEK